ncbi:WXG100 family type VII secretion target [Actinophytocola sp.]|jgi:ESAT-6 family protein|uniref:WXG100 family type VII secretion target n=1 Tax=Actinophytocola sp. TaxID=1872138 RepID=UPI002D2D00EE|nr:WXG100 family type VII secretion target [Actinophytocola sp.]HYQ61622.1 WXG100 family type VII secretion target [Actinophytocola sp.]
MPDGYAGTPQEFTAAHQNVVKVKEDVEGELSNLWNAISQLQGLWAGPAQKAFTTMMHRFDDDAKRLNTALEGIAEQLKAAGSTYEESEQSQMDVFGNLSSQLDG